MITEYDIYWITRLNEIKSLLGVASFGAILFMAFVIIGAYCVEIKYKKLMLLLAVFLFLCCGVFSIARMLTPTTEEMVVIKAIPALANSKALQETLPKEAEDIYAMAKEWLKKKTFNREDAYRKTRSSRGFWGSKSIVKQGLR